MPVLFIDKLFIVPHKCKHMKIMIVDDQPDIRQTIKMILSKHRYESIEACDGVDCLKKIKKTKPDLILLDIMMPRMSGWEVCSKIKLNPETEDIPIIFITGKTDEISQAMSLNGAEGYISKPFDPIDLMKVIDGALRK